MSDASVRPLRAWPLCCFCGEAIEANADPEALDLVVWNLWARARDADHAAGLFAHSSCFTARLHPRTCFSAGALTV